VLGACQIPPLATPRLGRGGELDSSALATDEGAQPGTAFQAAWRMARSCGHSASLFEAPTCGQGKPAVFAADAKA